VVTMMRPNVIVVSMLVGGTKNLNIDVFRRELKQFSVEISCEDRLDLQKYCQAFEICCTSSTDWIGIKTTLDPSAHASYLYHLPS
jgi:hypothetical protein